MAVSERAIAKSGGSDFLALAPESSAEVAALIRENLGNSMVSRSDFDTVAVPAAGATTWMVPGVRGEQAQKALVGVIVAWSDPRGYWPEKYDGQKRPPVCRSEDGETGVFSPEAAEGRYSGPALGGDCASCPMAQWESDGGRGQACKQMRTIALLTPSGTMPVMLTLPPTSIAPVRKYFFRLASGQIHYRHVVSKLTLEKVSNGNVPDYARVVIEWERDLEPSEVAAADRYAASILPSLQRAAAAAVSGDA